MNTIYLRIIFFMLIIGFLSSCGYTQEEEEQISLMREGQGARNGEPKVGKNLSLQGKNIQLSLFDGKEFLEKMEATEFSVCEKNKYLIPNTKYCSLFKDFYFVNKRREQDHFYILAKEAYSDKNQEQFLFHEMIIVLKAYPYLLRTTEATLSRRSKLLKSLYKDTFSELKEISGGLDIKGYNMLVNYGKHLISIDKPIILMEEEGDF